ncbi:MAG: heme o synthase [Cytophagales bacterium]
MSSYYLKTQALSINQKLSSIVELSKFRLSFLVVFSAAFGYFLFPVAEIDYFKGLIMCLAGFLMTVGGNIMNQIIEKDSDKLMKRTFSRPLPSDRLSVEESLIYGVVCVALSSYLFIAFINIKSFLLAFSSFLIYSFIYTPLKKKHPIAVTVGAIPGALPPMIGWVAASNKFGWEPGILFAIQFIWQFPHFWAIAWVLDEDYKKAGIRLLPGTGKNVETAFQIMIYTTPLLPLSVVPYALGMSGWISMLVAFVLGVLFLIQTFNLMKNPSEKAAKQIMFGSFIYLPLVQISFLLDKI